MPHVSLRVSSEEKTWMESYASVLGISLSDAIKEAFFQKMEDEYDLEVIQEYEIEKAKGGTTLYTHNQIKKELGIN
jgi:hypothetical protein